MALNRDPTHPLVHDINQTSQPVLVPRSDTVTETICH
jgi:hypothetical protein